MNKMETWLDQFYTFILENIFKMNTDSVLGDIITYFLTALSVIIILLILGIFIISFLRTYIDTQKIKLFLEKHNGIKANLMASILGIITPFCSCSSIPIFIGFVEAGIPLGVSFSFLITSPIINEAAFIILLASFGWKIALVYLVAGVLIGVVGGMIIGKMHMENQVQDYIYKMQLEEAKTVSYTFSGRLEYSLNQVKEIVGKIFPYLLLGIGIGATIHGWIPASFISKYTSNGLLGVPIATLVGVPLYIDASGIIPITNAFLEKGMAMGTAMSFMMSCVALSLPGLLILKKVIKTPLILMFTGILTVGIILIGYFFNIIV